MRVFAAIAALACTTTACAPRPSTPQPPSGALNLRAIPRAFPEDLIAMRRSGGVTMRIYDTGWIQTHGGAVSSMKSWDADVRVEEPVFLIKHAAQGYILFDAGLSTSTAAAMNSGFFSNLFMHYGSRPGQDAASQLRRDGVEANQVRWVILSDLELDRAERADDFPGATIVASRRAWEEQKAAQARNFNPRAFDPAAHEGRWKIQLIDFSTAPPFASFDHGVDLFGDGSIELLDLPGHVPGNMGAWVNLDGGPVLLAGDAATVIDNYMDLALPCGRLIQDLDAYWRSVNAIKSVQDALPRLVVFPGHDLSPRSISMRGDLPLVSFPDRP